METSENGNATEETPPPETADEEMADAQGMLIVKI